ncbi:MAG: DNA alkylation repair protein [Bacillota bacterium]|nr:DNA alkylation repair protein [Clostridia bacterium]
MSYINQIKSELGQYVNPEKAAFFPRFFKTGPGEYGEGDVFIGVTVPHQRKVARKYFKDIDLKELQLLLRDPVHEYRLTALFVLVYKYEKAREEVKKEIVDFYLANIRYVNNWDLVDASADKILGAYLFHKDKKILYDFANSGSLWEQRIAIISTFYFIKKNYFQDTLEIAKLLLHHEHDLIHKAVGWMLREVGKRDLTTEIDFLQKHYQEMPRTMLRYAIEKFDPELREYFLKK